MDRIGPPLETLTRRLTDTPAEFLDAPRLGGSEGVAVAALVNDLPHKLGGRAEAAELARFAGRPSERPNRLALVMIGVWLLDDDALGRAGMDCADVLRFLGDAVGELADITAARQFVADPDRREELARVALARLGMRPEGESVAQAGDRLSSVSGTERRRLVAASREAERRARAIREALAAKAAQESADKMTRE